MVGENTAVNGKNGCKNLRLAAFAGLRVNCDPLSGITISDFVGINAIILQDTKNGLHGCLPGFENGFAAI